MSEITIETGGAELGRINARGEVEISMSIENLEREAKEAADLSYRAWARLFLEIALLRQKVTA